MSEITIAELCKWWNPVNNRPGDTTRFGPLMTQAWHQQQARDKAALEAARQPPAPPEPVAPAPVTGAIPPNPHIPVEKPKPVRRPRKQRTKVEPPPAAGGTV